MRFQNVPHPDDTQISLPCSRLSVSDCAVSHTPQYFFLACHEVSIQVFPFFFGHLSCNTLLYLLVLAIDLGYRFYEVFVVGWYTGLKCEDCVNARPYYLHLIKTYSAGLSVGCTQIFAFSRLVKLRSRL